MICIKCKKEKDIIDFMKLNKQLKICLDCRTKKKEYREANKDKIKEKSKEYYEANKDKIKDYYEANKNKIIERTKEYREANKDKIKERKKEYNETNKDKIKDYYEANKDKIKERTKEYREANKDKIKERKKEYANKIKQENPLKLKIRNMIGGSRAKDKKHNRTYDDIYYVDYDFLFGLWTTQEGKCFYCKCDMELTFIKNTREPKQITLQRTNNDIAHIKSNVVLSCFLCNCVLHMENE